MVILPYGVRFSLGIWIAVPQQDVAASVREYVGLDLTLRRSNRSSTDLLQRDHRGQGGLLLQILTPSVASSAEEVGSAVDEHDAEGVHPCRRRSVVERETISIRCYVDEDRDTIVESRAHLVQLVKVGGDLRFGCAPLQRKHRKVVIPHVTARFLGGNVEDDIGSLRHAMASALLVLQLQHRSIPQ
jgi:hypothetical protein